ncbi:hypothetical protein TTHERM_01028760 (macronuclear) [Tetrahymena thermophila SB210]|uniref:Uncharacterized protein n=1 Tax=Tetrahymena thermophila (strain SB210) TaxID=312017 RepID=Q23EG4_TETTS|nr:hypothetical protein TTHERM_01028760 [Tetrahymena thermophila SB210]EAR94893.3 hypothetical protein TTHERM_01028760 [Tetrahymena thermophila SB210]|eukprot:XP_001015138.3 hypothetical protein TTHERM_01028760 [Tetrahymena thermophila SB210]
MIPENNNLFVNKNSIQNNQNPVLFCWGVDNELFVYDQNNSFNSTKSKKGQAVNLYFSDIIPPSFRDMVKDFSEIFQNFHNQRQKIDENFIKVKSEEIKMISTNQQTKYASEKEFMEQYQDISVQALDQYIDTFKRYLQIGIQNQWTQQHLNYTIISLIYYDFIKNLKIEKQRSKLKKIDFSKSEMIVRLLNLYQDSTNPTINQEILTFDVWSQIYHFLKNLNISQVICLLEDQKGYEKRIILNIIDALKMKKYFFKGQDARLIPKQEFIRRHEEFKQRIQEISKNVNPQSELYFFLQVLSGNIQFIHTFCQQDWMTFVIFYILFANPIFTIDQLKTQIHECYQHQIEKSGDHVQQMFFYLITQLDCYASIQKAQGILHPFYFFHLIDILQVAEFTFDDYTPTYDQLQRNFREEIQFKFLQYLQNDIFDYQLMSIYINNFVQRVDIIDKKLNHSQIFEDLLVSKSNTVSNFAQIVQDVQKEKDPILNESVKSQISAKAMSLLQQNQYDKALEFYIQLADFQIEECPPQNEDFQKVLTGSQLKKIEENYKYLRELIVNLLFQRCDVDLKSIVDCLEKKSCIINKYYIHTQVIRKHLNFLYSYEKLADAISKLNRDNNFQDKNLLGSIEQDIYNLIKLQNCLSKELVIGLRLIETVLKASQIKLSQQIYNILVLRTQQLMREIKENIMEYELLNDIQNIQIYKQLNQEMQHFISIVMNSYTL